MVRFFHEEKQFCDREEISIEGNPGREEERKGERVISVGIDIVSEEETEEESTETASAACTVLPANSACVA